MSAVITLIDLTAIDVIVYIHVGENVTEVFHADLSYMSSLF